MNKNLSRNLVTDTEDLNPATAGSILEASRKKGETELGAYLYALTNANLKTIEEALAMAEKGLPFDRWVEETGLAAKWRAEGKKTAWEAAIAFLKQGHTVEELERMPPPATVDSSHSAHPTQVAKQR